MPISNFVRVLVICVSVQLIAASAGQGETVEEFYRGKTVTLNLGQPEGASWALYARTAARFLGDYIPGKPTVIVQFMPGAGGVVASNYVYNVAARDGSVIGIPMNTAIVYAAREPSQVKFDPRNFNWLGSMAVVQDVISVWHTSPVKTLEEARKTEIIMGATGRAANSYEDTALVSRLLGVKFKIVLGYKGGNEINLAMERGEVQGRATAWEGWTASNPDWLRDKKVIHLVQLGPKKLPEIGDNVPLLRDLITDSDDLKIVDFLGLSLATGRALYAPPGVPMDRVAGLRTAFEKMMVSKDYQTEAKARLLDTETWQTGAEIETRIREGFNISPELIERAAKLLE